MPVVDEDEYLEHGQDPRPFPAIGFQASSLPPPAAPPPLAPLLARHDTLPSAGPVGIRLALQARPRAGRLHEGVNVDVAGPRRLLERRATRCCTSGALAVVPKERQLREHNLFFIFTLQNLPSSELLGTLLQRVLFW